MVEVYEYFDCGRRTLPVVGISDDEYDYFDTHHQHLAHGVFGAFFSEAFDSAGEVPEWN